MYRTVSVIIIDQVASYVIVRANIRIGAISWLIERHCGKVAGSVLSIRACYCRPK